MLNIGKVAPGGESYYLETVASGVEDYYTGAGEAPGYWLGAAAGELGLSARVAPEALRAVLGATDPATGEPLTGRMSRRSVPGFDCTFRAPKSVSLLFALGDPEVSNEVRNAADAAIAASLPVLEQAACRVRRGKGGLTVLDGDGFVAAAFRHRTSRAGDPHLHTHALAANVVERIDGGWGAMHSPHLYRNARTAGFVYQAVLRAELTERLSVQWSDVVNGHGEVAGIDPAVVRHFSDSA